jgi:hypothetical protein
MVPPALAVLFCWAFLARSSRHASAQIGPSRDVVFHLTGMRIGAEPQTQAVNVGRGVTPPM